MPGEKQIKKPAHGLSWPAAAPIPSPRHEAKKAKTFFGQYLVPAQEESVADKQAGIRNPYGNAAHAMQRAAQRPYPHHPPWRALAACGQGRGNRRHSGQTAQDRRAPAAARSAHPPAAAGRGETRHLPRGARNRGGRNRLGLLSCLFLFSHLLLFWLLKGKTSYRMRQQELIIYVL